MRVLFFSPGFPYEMPLFCTALARQGVEVVGIGDQPQGALPAAVRTKLADYVQLDSLWDESAAAQTVSEYAERYPVDGVECLWEPGMLLAARLRELVGAPGMDVQQTRLFRDKEEMKRALDRAGLRTPQHKSSRTESGCRAAAEEIGYPLIIKPVAGAGSADTYRVENTEDLDRTLLKLRHVDEVSVEEYIEGEEYTFDTISVAGEPQFINMAWYRPKPLQARSIEWISPQTVTLRDPEAPGLAAGRELGLAVLKALDFATGFTHMEWFLKPDGSAVFGEIAARPPGARSVELMNYACDFDAYTAWAQAVVDGRLAESVQRDYNAAVVFKRARGEGRITRVEGLDRLLYHFGPHVAHVDLLRVGEPRRNWKQTLVSDGYVIVRHPSLERTLEMADQIGTDLTLYAEPET